MCPAHKQKNKQINKQACKGEYLYFSKFCIYKSLYMFIHAYKFTTFLNQHLMAFTKGFFKYPILRFHYHQTIYVHRESGVHRKKLISNDSIHSLGHKNGDSLSWGSYQSLGPPPLFHQESFMEMLFPVGTVEKNQIRIQTLSLIHSFHVTM